MPCESDDKIAYIVDGSGPDGQFQWGVDDLQESVRVTLADFLHCLTSEPPNGNAYSVPGGLEMGSYLNPDGEPAAIQTGGPYQDSAFSTDPLLDTWSNPFLDALAETIKVADYLQKGQDGHDLLQNVRGRSIDKTGKSTWDDGDTSPERQVSQVLRNNRFNPTVGDTPFVSGDDVPDPPKLIPTEGSLGAYTDPVTGEILATTVSVETMRKVALSLMLKATGDDSDGTVDPDSATALAPTWVQMGSSRVEPSELEARRAYGVNKLSRVSLDSDFSRVAEDDSKSYGQMNSFLEPFDGFLPLGMLSLAATTTVTLIVSAQVIFGLLSLVVNSDDKTIRLDPGPYVPGQHGHPELDGLLGTFLSPRTLGLIHTENNFADCALRGANVFFGFSGDDITTAAEDSLVNLLTAPGYYAVTTRSIFRSLNTIMNSLKDIDFSNPVSGAQATLGVVDVIRSSKVISFFNVIAGLGDTILRLEHLGYKVEPGAKQWITMVDDLPDNPSTHVMKSRAADGPTSVSLAWRTASTAGVYVLPASLISAAVDYGGNQRALKGAVATHLARQTWESNDGTRKSSLAVSTDLQGGNRIRPDVVQAVENVLESEYVPFYFHDLRTNEIISFHAFLTALSDSYTANYDGTHAYGRIDPIQIYKSTQRSIDLTFHVVATNRDDFDVMWWKINKLVTLLYPQWSEGRLVKNSDETQFIQPFSQIPTASPLIRLRIGDVIKSNYSKFNLARLFGLGTDKFVPESGVSSSGYGEHIYPKDIDVATSIITRMTLDPDVNVGVVINGQDVGYAKGDRAFLRPSTVGYYIEEDSASNALQQVTNILTSGSARKKLRTVQEYEVEITDRKVSTIDSQITPLRGSQKTNYQVKFVGTVTPPGFENLEVRCTHADLRIDPDYVAEQVQLFNSAFSIAENDQITSAVSSYFSSNNNPIVRAFDSAKGRGLAGVITSMKFDWYRPTWETDIGSRAPKWCEINMSFSPIHDIPPGLDCNGFNRAPIYPVGVVGDIVGDVYEDEIRDLVRSVLSVVDEKRSSTNV